MDEKSILIGIPSMREDRKFFSSIYSLVEQLKGKYKVSIIVEKWRDLAEAQNRITEYFLQNDFDYLLFCDDDVYGHTRDMVDGMISANAMVASVLAYQRHFPFPSLLMQGDQGIELPSGYAPIDLTGFQMCLIRKDTFGLLRKPYFIGGSDGTVKWATDFLFFKRLSMAGAKMIGCWDFCLDHAGISRDNVDELRKTRAPSFIDRLVGAYITNRGGQNVS